VVNPTCHCNESCTNELSHHEENHFVTQTNPTVHCDSEHHPDTPEPCQNEDCFCCIAKLPSKLMCLSTQAEMTQPLPNWHCLVRPDPKFPPLIPPPKHT
ncbi:MAG TPA: hypothetical protein PLU80_17735, partial [Acidobacteriota bacterium]|nr:hypothetical protein [Acidobacteriota bacterium]